MRRIVPRVWTATGMGWRTARAVLTPAAVAYAAGMTWRRRLYRNGRLRRVRLPLPAVAVGNLAVGGAGKTPVAGWIARWFATQGVRPGILLRGYGGDEGTVHRAAVPNAVVVEDADRLAGARRAHAGGADVLVLDDAFQRLDVGRDLDIVLVAAESARSPMHTLPAGCWRERWSALADAQIVVVTRKSASDEDVDATVRRVRGTSGAPLALARLRIDRFVGVRTGRVLPCSTVAGARVTAGAGIADPATFALQLARLGAAVRLVARPDHHAWRTADVADLLHDEPKSDYVVVTAKDAVTLASVWPADAAEPIVASLAVEWESGGDTITDALRGVVSRQALASASDTYRKGHAFGVSRASI